MEYPSQHCTQNSTETIACFALLHFALCTLHSAFEERINVGFSPTTSRSTKGWHSLPPPHTIYMPRQWRTVSIPHGAVRNFFLFHCFGSVGRRGASQHSGGGGWSPHCCSVCCQEGIVLSLRPLSCTSPPPCNSPQKLY